MNDMPSDFWFLCCMAVVLGRSTASGRRSHIEWHGPGQAVQPARACSNVPGPICCGEGSEATGTPISTVQLAAGRCGGRIDAVSPSV